MLHIVNFSGGKDSTCMLLMMLEKGMQVDDIIFCDTGMEFPQMYEHIEKVRKYISKYGKDITILRAENSYDYMMFDYTKKRGKRKGQKGYGWATMLARWCTAYYKRDLIKRYIGKNDYISYIGIAYDEPKRHSKILQYENHPLYDWKITEKQALQYCYDKGFDWGGLYQKFYRVSCWCCPMKSLEELRILYHNFPDLWEKLKNMDNRAWNQFRKDYSVEQLEEKFNLEDQKKERNKNNGQLL